MRLGAVRELSKAEDRTPSPYTSGKVAYGVLGPAYTQQVLSLVFLPSFLYV